MISIEIQEKSILNNHILYTYLSKDIDDIIERMNNLKICKDYIVKNHSHFKFDYSLSKQEDQHKLELEVWMYPKLLMN